MVRISWYRRRFAAHSAGGGLLLISFLLIVAGCGRSESEDAKSPSKSPDRATIDLDNTPTKIPLPPIRPSESPDPIPRIVETIQSRGGKVTWNQAGVTAIDWQRAPIHNLDLELLTEVPELERLYLARTRIDSRGFQYLAALPNLKRLALWGTPIQNNDLKFLASAKELKVLDLHSTKISSSGLRHLANCEELERLILRNTACRNDCLDTIVQLPSLRVLDLDQTQVRSSAIGPLKNLPNLEELRMYFQSDALPLLAEFPNIRRLELRHPSPLPTISHLAKMKKLESIQVRGASVRDELLGHLAKCPNLEEIHVQGARRLTDRGIAHLRDRPSLRLLDVRDTQVTIDALQALAQANADLRILVYPIELHRLERAFHAMGLGAAHRRDGGPRLRLDRELQITTIRLDDARIFPEGLRAVGQAINPEKLEHLSLGHSNFNVAHLSELPAPEKLPNLKHLKLNATQITPKGLKKWGGGEYPELLALETLDLGNLDLDDDSLAWIGTLDGLKTLRLAGVPGVSVESWSWIGQLTELEELDCSQTNWDDETFAVLESLPRLEILRLNETEIKGEGLSHLKACPNLKALSLSGIQTNEPDWSFLQEMPKLEHLDLSNGPLDDDQLPAIGDCRHLKSLSLKNTAIQGTTLSSLADQTRIESLDLSQNKLAPEAWEAIAKFPSLRRLNLAATAVPDEALAAVGSMKDLEWLSLKASNITDQGIAKLKSLSRLKALDLGVNPITSRSLPILQALPTLEFLNLNATKIQSPGYQRLRKTNPKLQLNQMPSW